jgi:putative tricarboxylic transport membrane protein
MALVAGAGIAFISAAAVLADDVWAQTDWKPDRNVEIIVGTPPGSGYDSVARKLQEIWQTGNLVEKSVSVVNKPGGFNAVGNTYLNSHPGNASYLAITGTLLLSDNLSGNTTMSFKDFTPLAVLLNEEIAFAVNPASPIRTGKDFIDRLKQDPASVSVAISGIGGQNHIALGLVAQAGGADASRLKVVGFQGGAEAVTAALGGHVDATVGPASVVAPQVEAGKLRVIGVPSAQRLGGIYAQIPTWREQGVDAVFLAVARPHGPQRTDRDAGRLLGRRPGQDRADQGLEGPHRAHPADLPLSRQRPGARLHHGPEREGAGDIDGARVDQAVEQLCSPSGDRSGATGYASSYSRSRAGC